MINIEPLKTLTINKSNRLLSQIKIGEKVTIISFMKDLETKSTLISMGILPGDELEVISKSIFGSPISFKHGQNNFFALRSNQAKLIEVK
ncbi:MAG: ferrous iron transport protein A [Candidatus Sericytochromatia bacterium]|nr:ferrous iron transport protein A [Candidatus Sericytochromatia bacterium]